MNLHLTIGNLNYSSWSLRAWLALRWAGVGFDETRVELDQPGYGERGIEQVKAVSPSGLVPVLRVDGEAIWDTMAIAEWAGEQAPRLVPTQAVQRAQMRSAMAEMHAGFAALRAELPMNLRRRCVASNLTPAAQRDLRRIDELWSGLCGRYGGPYLLGQRSLADAFYLPVATRLRTYGVELSAASMHYAAMLLRDPDFQVWEQRALAEPAKPFSRAPIDSVHPGTDRT